MVAGTWIGVDHRSAAAIRQSTKLSTGRAANRQYPGQGIARYRVRGVGGGGGIGDVVAPLIQAHDFKLGEWFARLVFLCLSIGGITCPFCFRVNPSFRKLYVT